MKKLTNKLPPIREHDLQILITHWLQAHGWFVIRQNSGMVKSERGGMVRLGETGMPDLMAFKRFRREIVDKGEYSWNGQVDLLFCEVKTPQNPEPTFAQHQKMMELSGYGARCIIVHSLEELEEQLQEN